MTVKLVLGLRNNQHRVDLIKTDESPRPVLGTASPSTDEMARREHVTQHWRGHAASPRAPRLPTIDEPLDQRTQTTLYYRVDEKVRQRLDGRRPTATASRREEGDPEQVSLQSPDLGTL
ncbi:hypothetical protein [Herbaspirillum rubrisubalbicans]|uniref:Uncharacterized protein n=1 Tax=Herbaspirillum rubrisubalbicans TaxID=80842 RepID=A0AAD0XHA6_9BURK|nr:hypothetical protein [Herbaspirillum rubrisubalbicans]AYR24589.1 hypothetical protein RC54_12495 [Herbaspirillum rubrisubalbicans]